MSSQEPIGTAVIVLNNKKQVLLGKRKNAYKSGKYGLPGGRTGRSEKLVDGVKRELFEETFLEAVEISYVGVIKEWQGEAHFIHFIYLCTEWKGELQVREPDKCEGWEWFDVDSLPSDLLSGHGHAVKLYLSGNSLADV